MIYVWNEHFLFGQCEELSAVGLPVPYSPVTDDFMIKCSANALENFELQIKRGAQLSVREKHEMTRATTLHDIAKESKKDVERTKRALEARANKCINDIGMDKPLDVESAMTIGRAWPCTTVKYDKMAQICLCKRVLCHQCIRSKQKGHSVRHSEKRKTRSTRRNL